MYKYRPESVRSLSVLICGEIEEYTQKAYFANVMWGILQYASMGKSTFPSWAEAFPAKEKVEEETAEEIMAKIVRDLKG